MGRARGGVGAHFRHVLDHYERFARGLESGTIDYDLRERDREIETVRARALERLDELCTILSRLERSDVRRALVVRVDCGEPDGGSVRLAQYRGGAVALGYLQQNRQGQELMQQVTLTGTRTLTALPGLPSLYGNFAFDADHANIDQVRLGSRLLRAA